ncbi:MAG: RNA 2',3'-cyclic phosphodiesterase [Thermodesulfobacteriota bacterium]
MNSMRVFIALELPETIIAALARVQKDLRPHGLKTKWVKPENIHLTLKFLGDIRPEQVEPVAGVLQRTVARKTAFPLTAKEAGVFPSIRRPNVFWIGLAGELAPLVLLQQELDRGLGELGFALETRPFKGHLTLGRFKGPVDPDRLIQALRSLADFQTPAFTAETVTLFRSDLHSAGPVYTRLSSGRLNPS